MGQVGYEKYDIEGLKSVTIGTAGKCHVILEKTLKDDILVEISNGNLDVKSKSKQGVSVNGYNCSGKSLKHGDVIRILELTIVYLGNILALTAPLESAQCNLPVLVPGKYMMEVGNGDNAYFQRSPRIIKKVEEGKIEIDSPPSPGEKKDQPLILTIGPSLTMGMGMVLSLMFTIYSGRNNPLMVIPGAIMTGAMLAGSVLWPFFLRTYQKLKRIKDEKQRKKKYRTYIEMIYSKLEEKIERNKKILANTYPEPTVLVNRVINGDRRLWERMPSYRDFLEMRLGFGSIPSPLQVSVPRERFSMVEDPLLDELRAINDEYVMMQDAPITISLLDNNMMGIIGNRKMALDLARSLIIQTASLHSYDEVKLIMIMDKNEQDYLSWIKRLPHVWGFNKSIRFIAASKDELRDVMFYLNEVIKDREETTKNNSNEKQPQLFLPYYIVFVFSPEMVEDEPVMRHLTSPAGDMGVSTVFVYEKLNMLPKECNAFVECNDSLFSLYHRDNPVDGLIEFKPDPMIEEDLISFSYILSGTKVKELASSQDLPGMLTFMGLYKAGRIEHLDIASRWKTNLSYRTLEAPIGVRAGNNLFKLNIHEKFHGPHGLIAGMTGSGKSEFIQCYILSMAVNYHPHDISFILIDYKGGGMANCFIGLPHIAGMITNLGGSAIRRSLTSLESELKRRQKIFAECGVNHIDIYQQLYKEGKAPEPLPHLIIISDEFAELKAQQPEFMQELVSTARIGRSLGVHLILATQRPSGVVDNQIWSNAGFRICLKVLDNQDSNEMLKRTEAANITEPGRCYVQVGNNEVFELVQSAWSGAPYVPTDQTEEEDKAIIQIDNCGRAVRMLDNQSNTPKSSTSQLATVVAHISQIAAKHEIRPLKLWMEPLKEVIFVDEVHDFSSTGWNGQYWDSGEKCIRSVVGLYDDPKNQVQLPAWVDFSENGHLLLYGGPGTGKTTFLQTMVYSLIKSYSPERVNFYIFDFGGRTMSFCNALPHTGGVVFSDNSDKVDKTLKLLMKELDARKREYAEYGVGTLQSFMDASGKTQPALFLIIDNYAAFCELYPDNESIIITLAREGGNYGIYLVLAASGSNSVKLKLVNNFKTFLALQLNDKFDYTNIFGQANKLEPEPVKGRGLLKTGDILEFQTALAGSKENEAERVLELTRLFQEMKSNWHGANARPIPHVPEPLTPKIMLENDDCKKMIKEGIIPLGYDADEAELVGVDFSRTVIYPILGFNQTGKTTLLKSIIICLNALPEKAIIVVDGLKRELKKTAERYAVDQYVADAVQFDKFIDELTQEVLSRVKALREQEEGEWTESSHQGIHGFEKIYILVDNFSEFFDMISDEALGKLVNLIGSMGNAGVHFIFTATPSSITKYSPQPLYGMVFNGKQGMLLGGRMDSQSIFSPSMSFQQRTKQYDSGTGYMIIGNSYRIVKTPSLE